VRIYDEFMKWIYPPLARIPVEMKKRTKMGSQSKVLNKSVCLFSLVHKPKIIKQWSGNNVTKSLLITKFKLVLNFNAIYILKFLNRINCCLFIFPYFLLSLGSQAPIYKTMKTVFMIISPHKQNIQQIIIILINRTPK
jgi:hypothetical protein